LLSSSNRLIWVGGDDEINKGTIVINHEVRPLHAIDLSYYFTTPSKAQRYISFYRLVQPDGQIISHRLWIDITVLDTGEEENAIAKIKSLGYTDTAQIRKFLIKHNNNVQRAACDMLNYL